MRKTIRSESIHGIFLASLLTLLLGLVLLAREASGQDFNKYFGAALGFATVSGGVGTGLAYGLHGGYFPSPQWGAGAFLRSSSLGQGITLMSFGAEGLYRLQEFVPGLTLGVGIGEAKFSGNRFDGNYHFMGGAKGYYEFYLPSSMPFALGAEAGLMWSKPATEILSLLHVMATAKYWF